MRKIKALKICIIIIVILISVVIMYAGYNKNKKSNQEEQVASTIVMEPVQNIEKEDRQQMIVELEVDIEISKIRTKTNGNSINGKG